MADSFIAGMRAMLESQPLQPTPTRIAPNPVLPDARFPQLTLNQVGGEELESLEGLSGLTQTIQQINAWSPSYEDAFALRAAVVAMLSTFTGSAGTTGLVVDCATMFTYRELYDAERELHQLIVRCVVWWGTP